MGNEVMIKQETSYELSTGVFFNNRKFQRDIRHWGKMFASSTLVPQAYQKGRHGLHYSS